MSVEREIESLKALTPEELEKELLLRHWYVHHNDLIGGFCLMPVDAPPSSGCFPVADFISESSAVRIADLHNRDLELKEELEDSFLSTDERLSGCVERWPECRTGDYNPSCCRFPKSCSCDIR
jgi:hypothetical protein